GQKLAQQDPANSGWQRDVSVSLEKVGDVLLAQGKLDQALEVYQQSREIRQKLAQQDPSNVLWKTDLVLSLWKIASVLERQGAPQKREAGVNYKRALEILRHLAVENRLTADQNTWMSRLEARLKAITEEPAKGPNDNSPGTGGGSR
ncbi:MAG: tetratricopeptide repeat protein, partial [Verrucomicrobia bacterium]|nr:tetratricopeptide repeat protein [Verrucomicrobiota bacterium]